jgi:hypothetical protein
VGIIVCITDGPNTVVNVHTKVIFSYFSIVLKVKKLQILDLDPQH